MHRPLEGPIDWVQRPCIEARRAARPWRGRPRHVDPKTALKLPDPCAKPALLSAVAIRMRQAARGLMGIAATIADIK
jgi:hypothetical protein